MSFVLDHRFLVEPSILETVRTFCEVTQDWVWIGSKGSRGKQRLRRCTLRGVPAKRIDLALLETVEPGVPICVEIGTKTGRFDLTPRPQIVLRHWRAADTQPLAHGRLRVEVEDPAAVAHDSEGFDGAGKSPGAWVVISAVWHPRSLSRVAVPGLGRLERTVQVEGGSWIASFEQLKSDLVGYDLVAIVRWHWRRYYTVPLAPLGGLPPPEVDSAAAEFVATVEPKRSSTTLAEANRLASRLLYDAARRLGWRKLSHKEQVRWGLTACNQWVSEATYAAARYGVPSEGHPSGTGQHTLEAAAGRPQHGHGLNEE